MPGAREAPVAGNTCRGQLISRKATFRECPEPSVCPDPQARISAPGSFACGSSSLPPSPPQPEPRLISGQALLPLPPKWAKSFPLSEVHPNA